LADRIATGRRESLLEQVRECMPALDGIKEAAQGDVDLELVVARMEQIELLMEAMAEMRSAPDAAARSAAESKVAEMCYRLRDSLTGT